MTTTPDQWSQKYLREYPFIPFGSLMNAYCQINHGKGISVNEMETIADRLFEKAIELVKRAYESTLTESEEVDLPVKQ